MSDVQSKIQELLETGKLDSEDKKLVAALLTEHEKLQKRSERIIKQSDRMSADVAKNNEKLERLSDQLSRYLSPQIYNAIFLSDHEVSVKANRKKLTIFFSDICNFTSTTENLESEELVTLLNRYLTTMTDIALKHGATVDKYIGDAIVAFFGDPETKGHQEDALAAVKMAMEMQDAVRSFAEELSESGVVDNFQVRCGIATGFCTVGNFGSETRMDYTAIGGYVNLTARLESKAEPGQVLISEETFALIKDVIACEKKEAISMKGFDKPVNTYKVIDYIEKMDERMQMVEKYEKGFSLHLNPNAVDDKVGALKTLQEGVDRLKSIILDK
ncbi:MAG: adenylate/guanylate cyclase domain-containing protein [SAR324 cluster bacterium]|nr:adenylate/guanylate cyclase domain-containing protein [SAR324 cluster bacterium]